MADAAEGCGADSRSEVNVSEDRKTSSADAELDDLLEGTFSSNISMFCHFLFETTVTFVVDWWTLYSSVPSTSRVLLTQSCSVNSYAVSTKPLRQNTLALHQYLFRSKGEDDSFCLTSLSSFTLGQLGYQLLSFATIAVNCLCGLGMHIHLISISIRSVCVCELCLDGEIIQ